MQQKSDNTLTIPMLKPEEVAEILNVSVRTLETWRYKGIGPKYLKISQRCIRYRHCDIRSWQEKRIQRSTAENAMGV